VHYIHNYIQIHKNKIYSRFIKKIIFSEFQSNLISFSLNICDRILIKLKIKFIYYETIMIQDEKILV
jgi:hypothetical protein